MKPPGRRRVLRTRIVVGAAILLPVLIFCACSANRSRGIAAEFQTELSGSALYGLNRSAAAGVLNFDKTNGDIRRGVLEFYLDPPLPVFLPQSLVVEYAVQGTASPFIGRVDLVLRGSGLAYILPWDAGGNTIRYAMPLAGTVLEEVSITAAYDTKDRELIRLLKGSSLVLEVKSLDIIPQWYGFEHDSRGLIVSPFVALSEEGNISIDVPADFIFLQGADLIVRAGGIIRCMIGDLLIEGIPADGELFLPSGSFSPGLPSSPLRILVGGDDMESAQLVPAQHRPFPEPIPLDPGLILEYPRSSWRRKEYELFRWEGFPSLLIFDTADYAAQDRLFKRLAFFTEKAGYRGHLAGDEEIADQHGWNAHDYRAQDLARFFEAARLADFPLLLEERELEAVLLSDGIIRRDGERIVPGQGGIISISQESTVYLRSLFMTHEGFHGIFFVDEDFRDFSRRRWEALPPAARRFILSYFDYQHYDIQDEYLMINEFMAHVLQQPVSQAARYFGETLASRIDASPWRRTILPEKDEAAGNWPELAAAFRREAEAFNAYVNERWGLRAGQVYNIHKP
jgi:hypothetical protein